MSNRLTTQKVARIMGKSDEFVRVRFTTSDFFPFGYAIKLPNRHKYTYYINQKQFEDYLGIDRTLKRNENKEIKD